MRHCVRYCLTAVCSVLVALCLPAQPAGAGTLSTASAMPDTLIVRFRSAAAPAARAALHGAMHSTAMRSFHLIPADVVRVDPQRGREAVAADYAARPDVAYVQPNFRYTADAVPNDPKFARQWSLQNLGRSGGVVGADIDAVAAWDTTTGDRSVVVGIIDTGIDYRHPDLVDNLWTNEIERTGTPGVDDDGNGIVDDIYGAQFTGGSGVPTNGDPFDGLFHGTHVAGIIGATGNNGFGITGINHAVRLMAVKAFDNFGRGNTADAIAALEYAIAMGAQVTNNSWGGADYDQALRDAIEAAGQAGQLFIAAAGNASTNNDSSPQYPASYSLPNLIAVASTDRRDELSVFSSFGPTTVAIAAPGTDIYSTWPGGGTRYLSGTSMATPHVTGVAALLLARVPGAGPLEVKRWILDGADHVAALDGYVASGRRLNADGALAHANPSTGSLSFDHVSAACGVPLAIHLRDGDLAHSGTVAVDVADSGGDVESAQLIETATPGTFVGALTTRSDGVVAADGQLAILDGHTVTATYHDADDGTGGPAITTVTATVDCVPPQISNLQVAAVQATAATIQFATSEPAVGQVRYGTACGQLTEHRTNAGGGTAQQVELEGLTPLTQYFFVVDATDPAETRTTDDNSGACYGFSTPFQPNYFTYIGGGTQNRPNDILGQSITFTPDGSPNFYTACREPATAFPIDPSGGTPVFNEADPVPESFDVTVQNGQHVSLYGQSYTTFYVSRYGFVTFNTPDPMRLSFDLMDYFSQPRVAVLGRQTNAERGWVSVKHLPDRVAVTYEAFRDFGDAEESNGQIELFFDGRIRATTLGLRGVGGNIVGLSQGNGLPDGFAYSELDSAPSCGDPAPPTVALSGDELKFTYWVGITLWAEHTFKLDISDPGLVLPTPATASDPTVNGATLVLLNPTTGEHDFYALPASYWRHSAAGYTYERSADTRNQNIYLGKTLLTGPCRRVTLQQNRLRARCMGRGPDGMYFTLDEPGGEGSMAVLLTLGAGPNIPRYCSVFGGRIKKDTEWRFKSRAQFDAHDAPAPAQCPQLP